MHVISRCTILFIFICCVQFSVLFKAKNNEKDKIKNKDWNISFNPPEVTAVSGVCVLISCTFTYPAQPKTVPSNKCKNPTECKNVIEIQNRGRKLSETEQIMWLEPDHTKNNCSSIIKEIKEDEREYTFKFVRQGKTLHNSSVKIIIQDKPKMNIPDLSEGEETNLTCSAPFPCPEAPPEITWWITKIGGNIIYLNDNITLTTSEYLYLSTLTLTPSSDLHNGTVGCGVSYGSKNISTNRTLEVKYVKTLQILGNSKVMEGDTLSLNCTVESHPPSSDPVWSFNGTTETFMNQRFAGSLMITNVTKEHAGVYGCMRTYRNKTLNASFTISIIRDTNKLKVNESFSPGSNNTAPNDTRNTTGIIEDFLKNWDTSKILTFVAGMVCSALIFSVVLCCLVSCHRSKKHKVPTANPDTEVNLEMVPTDAAQTGTNEETPLHGQLNGGNPNTAGPTDGGEENEAVGMDAKETDYASIDYSLLKNRAPEEEEKEPTSTDYAEIKRDKRRDEKERAVLRDGDDQIETQDQMEGEEELYSNSQELKF